MKKIYKYSLEITDAQMIEMPEGAEVLTVQLQEEIPCIWAKVSPANKMVKYKVRIIGTGHAIYDDETLGKYIGTYLIKGDRLVFHVWIKEEKTYIT